MYQNQKPRGPKINNTLGMAPSSKPPTCSPVFIWGITAPDTYKQTNNRIIFDRLATAKSKTLLRKNLFFIEKYYNVQNEN